MFRNPKKLQKFPKGTFIPTKARILCILQLCLSFSLLFWILGKPFIEELFTLKRYSLMYENLIDREEYQFLIPSKKNILQEKYIEIKNSFENRALIEKIKKVIAIFFTESFFKLLWTICTIMISIMLLKKHPQSLKIVWILPCLTIFFLLENLFILKKNELSFEERLFPDENFLINNYLKKPLSINIIDQREELERAFRIYLKENWSMDDLFSNKESFPDFSFNIARFEAFNQDIINKLSLGKSKENLFFIIICLLWNFYFAIVCYKNLKQEIKNNNLISNQSTYK